MKLREEVTMDRFRRTLRRFGAFGVVSAVVFVSISAAEAQINVITVDCTPFVSPSPTSFGPANTMGMALQAVDLGGDFNVTEVTPAAFRGMSVAMLASYDLIAINNHPGRLTDSCTAGVGPAGLGTTWHSVVGVMGGGRVVLTSHDAPRFKLLRTPPAPPLFTGFEPFGTMDLVRQAALWAGGLPGQTGLLIFNDAARFATVGGAGWNNTELDLPAAWGIADLDQSGGSFMNGGYTDILPAFSSHPVYDGTAVGGVVLSDVRGAPNTLSSFSANIADTSFHSVFDAFNAAVFTPSELVVNAGVVDVLGLCFCSGNAAAGPDGKAITLIRESNTAPVASCVESVNPSGKKVPPAGSTTLPGPKGGQNEDGFYALVGEDAEDGTAPVFVTNASGSATFGPFVSGSVVKVTEAPGATPSSKPMGGPNSAVAAHIKLDSDAFVFAVDSFGEVSPVVSCLVPPLPK
jgi:hypothetical protein